MNTKSPFHGLRAARRARISARAIFVGFSLGLLPCATQAAGGSWNIDASGNWTASANWTGGVIAGNNPGDVASLAFNLTGARTVTIDGGNKVIGVLDIGDSDNTHAYTLGGSTALYFNNNASSSRINQLATSKGDTINAPLGIIGNGTLAITNASANTLTIGSYTQSGASGAATVILDTGSGAIDYKGPIVNGSGTVSVVKNGSGLLKLTGTAGNSTYSGGFTLNAGTLEFGYSQTALGTGTFTLNGGVITNGYGSARTNTNNNPQTWNANLTFGTTISSGQNLNLGTGPVSLTGNRVVTVNSTNTARTLTVGGVISGGFSLTKAGNATFTLSGANTYTGGTTLNAGVLALNHASAIGPGAFTITGGALDNTSGATVALSANNTQNWNGHFAFLGANALNLGSGAVALNANRTVTVHASSLTVGGVISGASRGLTLAGNGTLVLAGSNTYSGATTINGGVLVANTLANGGASSSVGASANVAANLALNGGVLRYTGPAADTDRSFTLGTSAGSALDASGSGPIVFANSDAITLAGADTPRTFTLTGSNTGDNTLAGVLSDNGAGVTSLVKSGSGTWVLSGDNTYSGDTTVTGGTLVVGASGSLGSGNLNLAGGKVVLGNASAFSEHAALAFSPSAGAGSINLDFPGAKAIAAVTDGVKHAVAGTYTAAQLNAFFGTSVFTGTGSLTVGSWVSVPLGGGGYVTGLASDSTGTDIYCRTDVGGVFRWVPTTAGNGAWLCLTDSIVPTTTPDAARLLFTSSIAVDPGNADNLYISVGSPGSAATRGIFASADRGATWTKINPFDDIVMDGNGTYRANGERLAVDPNNSSILWFGSTQQGLYKGVKSGATWTWSQIPSTSVPFGATTATSGKAGLSFVACDPNGGSTIVYAGVFDNTASATGGVYRSTDGGSTWAKVSGVAVNTPARGHVAANGTLYVTGGGIFARLPRGGSLAAITPAAGVNYRGVTSDPANPSIVYVAETNSAAQFNRLWRSANGGSTWSPVQHQNLNNNLSIPRSEPDGTPCVTGYWFGATSALLVTAADPDTLWAADSFGVARTENAGQLGGASVGSQAIWYMLQVNQEETYPETLKNAPTGPALMTGMADVGGYRYNDISQRPSGAAGNRFNTPANANTNSLDFCESDPSFWVRTWTGTVGNGSTGGFYGTGARSRDGGETWLLFGEIDRRYMTGPAGLETFDLTDYLVAEKNKGNDVVTLILTSDRSSTGGSVLQSFASKETTTSANRPTLLINGGTALLPTDDATVWGHPNYAGSPFPYSGTAAGNSFDVYYDGANDTWYRQAYLRFDLTNVSTITSATLRLYRTTSATGVTIPVGVFACADTSWTQGTLTWNNRPKPYASNTGKPFYDPRYTTKDGLVIGGGRVAVSSVNPRQIVWMPFGNATVPHYSDDGGVTWYPCSGLPANVNWKTSQSLPGYLIQQLTADRVNGTFYLQHLYGAGVAPKTVYKSVDGGINWTAAGTPPYASGNVWRCQIAAAPVAGHVWTTDDGASGVSVSGLWKSTNGATSFVRLPSITQVRVVSFGKPPAGSTYQYSTYFMGYYNGVKGVYRSDDYGATWTALPALPSVGDVESIAGDRQVHGSVFIGVGGRGVFQTQ